MSVTDEKIHRCAGCGIELAVLPVRKEGRYYCCEDCAAGKGCDCADRLALEEDRRRESAATPPGY